MRTLAKTVDAIGKIAAELPRLHREAARQYGVEVDSIVRSGSRDVGRIEQTLDGLLDFAADRDCLELFRRLCRHYWNIDPAARNNGYPIEVVRDDRCLQNDYGLVLLG